MQAPERTDRVLVIDDNPAIHADVRKILCPREDPGAAAFRELEARTLGTATRPRNPFIGRFIVDSAHQGSEGLEKVEAALAAGRPYDLVFVDIRMPPGWDGVETSQALWKAAPDLQIVICTAYSEYSWEELLAKIGGSDRLVILKKPFDPIEVLQLASALTEKAKLRRETLAYAGELERRVRERTAALEAANGTLRREVIRSAEEIAERKRLEGQLRESQKMEAFGQLAGGVAHDFNNLLTVIQGGACMLRSEPLTTEEKDATIEDIFQASQRAANLTRQLLTFSRRQPLSPRDLDLNEVIENMTKLLQRLVGEHIGLEARCAPGGAPVRADPSMLEQIIVNLAVNSRDAMPQGGSLRFQTDTVTIESGGRRLNSKARAGRFVRLIVDDTGSGISEVNLPHIFEPFFTTKPVGKGTGLGLATVFGIVEQHSGWIEVDSRIKEGTTFRIYFPEAPRVVATLAAPGTAPAPVGGHERILLVEDEPDVRVLMRTVLTHHGYFVREADNGIAALELWRQHAAEIDLLITDVVMPGGISGWDLADRLKAEKPSLKVIHSSGYADDMLGPLHAPRTSPEFLEKPFEPKVLLRQVRECLDSEKADPASAAA